MNQSELEARENACEQVANGLSFTSDSSRKWREIFDPITERSKAKPKQNANYFRQSIENHDKIVNSDHSNESYSVVRSCGVAHFKNTFHFSAEISLRIKKNHQNQGQWSKGKRAKDGNQNRHHRKFPRNWYHRFYRQNLFGPHQNQRSLKTRLNWLDRLFWLSTILGRLNQNYSPNHAHTPNLNKW